MVRILLVGMIVLKVDINYKFPNYILQNKIKYKDWIVLITLLYQRRPKDKI